MNLRQAQRTVVELVAKCQDLHLELPPEPFQVMLEAIQALKHSKQKDRIQPTLAMEEMVQRYPSPALKAQQEQREQEQQQQKQLKQQQQDTSNRKRGRPRKRRAIQDEEDLTEEEDKSPVKKKNTASSRSSPTTKTSSASSSKGAPARKSSRVSKIQENNPAKREENKELADQFVELGGYELKQGQKQKGLSRMKVAKELRNTDQVIKSGAQARQLERVGPSAAKKVHEIRKTGTMEALESYHKEEEEEAEVEEKPQET